MTPEQANARITLADFQHERRIRRWNRYIDILTNEYFDNMDMGPLAPNIVYSTVRRMVAHLMQHDPVFAIESKTVDYMDRARAVQTALNTMWEDTEANEQVELVVTDAVCYEFGVFKVGMGRTAISKEELEEIMSQEQLARQENEQLLSGQQVDVDPAEPHDTHINEHLAVKHDPRLTALPPDQYQQIMMFLDEHVKGHQFYYEEKQPGTTADTEGDAPDWPYLYRANPSRIFWEEGVALFNQSNYVVEIIKPLFDDFKDDAMYSNKKGIEPDSLDPDALELWGNESEDLVAREARGVARVTLHRIWDMRKREVSVWHKSKEKPVMAAEDFPLRYVPRYPFEMLRFNPVPDRSYGPSVIHFLEHPQAVMMDVFAGIAEQAKHGGTIWELVTPHLYHPEDVDAIKEDIENAEGDLVIEVKQPGSLMPAQKAQLDPAMVTLPGMLDRTAQEAAGLDEASRGIVSDATATAVTKATNTTAITLRNNAKRLRKALMRCAHMLLAGLREHGPDSLMVLATNGKSKEWLQFKKDDLLGRYQISVELPLPDDISRDQSQALNMLHEMRQSPNAQGDGLLEIEKRVLALFGFTDEKYLPEASVDVQEAIALEHEKMDKGEPAQPRRGESYAEHISKHEERLEFWSGLMTITQQRVQQAQQQMEQQAQQQMAQVQQLAQQDPAAAEQAAQQVQQAQQQAMQQNPDMAALQQIQQIIQIYQQHIDQTREMTPVGEPGRRRNAEAYPTGNPGTPESEIQNQIQGT